MTGEQRIPPLRDLPQGRLAARRRHLLAEIMSRGRGSVLHRRLAAVGAEAAAAGALLVPPRWTVEGGKDQ